MSCGPIDNEKLYHVFRLMSHVIRIYFNMLYHLLVHFYPFCSCQQVSVRIRKQIKKRSKRAAKKQDSAHSATMMFAMCIWNSPLAQPATSFNNQDNGVRHYHAGAVFCVGAVSQPFFPFSFPSTLLARFSGSYKGKTFINRTLGGVSWYPNCAKALSNSILVLSINSLIKVTITHLEGLSHLFSFYLYYTLGSRTSLSALSFQFKFSFL